jgi:hypothetical protein
LLFPTRVRRFYELHPLAVPSFRSLSRKHFRLRVEGGRFVKLNHFENRLTAQNMRFCCVKRGKRKTGLVCTYVGNEQALDRLIIPYLLDGAKFHGYPEPLNDCLTTEPGLPASIHSSDGAMKQLDQNLAEAAG